MNRSLLIIIVVVLAAAAAAFATGNWTGASHAGVAAMKSSLHSGSRGSLALFGAQAGGGAGAEEEDPADEGESATEPPTDGGSDESADEGGDAGNGEEAGGSEDENGDGSAADEDGSAEDESGAEAGDEEGAGGEEAAADEVASDEEAAGEEESAVDAVENFKNLDPRDIIIKKYDDLDERKTEPWDEESEGFIPNTGRSDPLTRVRSAVPDELKPPRAGETDMNEINTYLVAAQASMVVDAISSIIQCHNVIQIGLERYATFTFGDEQQASLPEGTSYSFGAGNVNGIPIIASLTVTSISTSQVVMDISATGQGTTTTVSKTKVFIPSKYY